MTLDWVYEKNEVQISRIDYVTEELICFQHKTPNKPQDQPYPQINTKYRSKVQYSKEKDSSPLLGKYEKRFIQEVTGNLLYYAQVVNCTMLAALGSIATQQSNPTKKNMKILGNS